MTTTQGEPAEGGQEEVNAEPENNLDAINIDDLNSDQIDDIIAGIDEGSISIPEADGPPEAAGEEKEETDEPIQESAEEEEQQSSDAQDAEDRLTKFRVRARTEVGEEMYRLIKANPYLSEEEALEQAKQSLAPDGYTEDEAEEAETDNPDIPPEFSALTPDEAQAKVMELRGEAFAKKKDWDVEGELELEEQALQLEAMLPQLRSQHEEKRNNLEEAQDSFDRTWEDNLTESESIYPGSTKEGSAIFEEIKRLDDEARDSDPDLWIRADKPLILAQRAALNLRISPNYGPPEGRVKQLPPQQQPEPRVPSATGVSRANIAASSETVNTPPTTIDEEIDGIDSLDELYDFRVKHRL